MRENLLKFQLSRSYLMIRIKKEIWDLRSIVIRFSSTVLRILISRLQSASVYWRNELRVGPLIAHLQTIFVTAVSSPSDTSRKSTPNIVSTKPQRIIVHQPSSPLPVMRAPRITNCRLLTRFVPVNTFINQNATAIVSPPGNWCGSKKRAILDFGYFFIAN